jgi:hypothetical protein
MAVCISTNISSTDLNKAGEKTEKQGARRTESIEQQGGDQNG